jgi:hypothetical protein
MSSKNPPAGALRVTTYDELRTFANGFAAGHLQTLILMGPAGVGKSRVLHDVMAPNSFWIDGNASPFGIFCAAYEHLDQPLILDDVDGLATDRKAVRLLKCLCQSDATRWLSWETNAAALEQRGIPRRFATSSQVALVCNSWASVSADVLAVQDRAHMLWFEPTSIEVHSRARTWFTDQEIFDFVGSHLHIIKQHSFRVYTKALELKAAGINWRPAILSRCLTGSALMVAQLHYDPAYPTTAAKVVAFVATGLGRRSTYFNHRNQLQLRHAVAHLPLVNPATAPNDATSQPGQSWRMTPGRLLLPRP